MRLLRPSAVAAAAALSLSAGAARAEEPFVPLLVSHHGRLLNASDQLVNGDVQITFNLFDTDNPNRTQPAWSEQRTVQVAGGYYGVLLGGAEKPLDPALLARPELFFSVTINGNELLPRQRLSSAPFALRAGRAAEAERVLAGGVNTGALQDGSVTLAKLQRTGGKMVGLDSDTLDGLDSSAFAPAAIEGSVDDILGRVKGLETTLASVKSTAEAGATAGALVALSARLDARADAIDGALTGIDGKLDTRFGTVDTKLGQVATAVGTVDTKIGTVDTKVGTVNTTVGTINTNVGALATQLDTLLKRGVYSPTCNEANTGYANRLDCLADGRWHTLVNVAPTDYSSPKDNVVTGAETCRWIIEQLVAANLRGRAGIWQVFFSYDQDATVYTGYYRAQDDSNLTLVRSDGAVVMTTDNSSVQTCSLPNNPHYQYVAQLAVKL